MSVPNSTVTPQHRRSARPLSLLELARQPDAWRPAWDRCPRWRLEHYTRRAQISGGAAGFAAVVVCAMNADGRLPEFVGRDELCKRARCTWRSFARWCNELERAGLIRRVYMVTKAGPWDYRREVTIRTAARFDQPCAPKLADLRMRPSVSPVPHKDSDRRSPRVSVGGYLSGRNACASEDQADHAPSRTERELFAREWPRLYRSRTDVPALRPEYRPYVRPDCIHCGQPLHPFLPCEGTPEYQAMIAARDVII